MYLWLSFEWSCVRSFCFCVPTVRKWTRNPGREITSERSILSTNPNVCNRVRLPKGNLHAVDDSLNVDGIPLKKLREICPLLYEGAYLKMLSSTLCITSAVAMFLPDKIILPSVFGIKLYHAFHVNIIYFILKNIDEAPWHKSDKMRFLNEHYVQQNSFGAQ